LKSRRVAQLEIARQKRASSGGLSFAAARRSHLCRRDIDSIDCDRVFAGRSIGGTTFGARAFARAADSDVIALWYRVMVRAALMMMNVILFIG
jgi:hypothetical protein